MKALFKILTLCVLTLTFSGETKAGIRDVGNGGDAVALEFIQMANIVLKEIEIDAYKLFPEFTTRDLREAIVSTKVVSKQKTILLGVEKDAINYPSKKLIEVSRSRWSRDSKLSYTTLSLVFHEYLGIMRINDEDFSVSNRLLEYFRDNKKRVQERELSGRTVLTDSDVFMSMTISMSDKKITLSGQVDGSVEDCAGTYQFDEESQILKADLQCNNKKTKLEMNYWNIDLVDYLRNGMVDIEFSFKNETRRFSKAIEAKHLR